MQYIKLKRKAEKVNLFSDENRKPTRIQPISHEDYEKLIAYLEKKNPPVGLPIQIAYMQALGLERYADRQSTKVRTADLGNILRHSEKTFSCALPIRQKQEKVEQNSINPDLLRTLVCRYSAILESLYWLMRIKTLFLVSCHSVVLGCYSIGTHPGQPHLSASVDIHS